MTVKSLVFIAVALATLFLAFVPYAKFVIQRSSLETDINMAMIDYNTRGPAKFREGIDALCRRNLLEPGSYEIRIEESRETKAVALEVEYQVTYRIVFVPRTERVVLRNHTTNLGS